MSMITALLEEEFSGTGASEKLYVDDVFSAYTYTGNGTTQTLTSGVDMTLGGMALFKGRETNAQWQLVSTLLGGHKSLCLPLTQAVMDRGGFGVSSFNHDGLTVVDSTAGDYGFNGAPGYTYTGTSAKYVCYMVREAPKFFAQKLVNHTSGTPTAVDLSSLGTIGMVWLKRTDAAGDWYVISKDMTAGTYLLLNSSNGPQSGNAGSIFGTSFTIPSTLPSGTYLVLGWADDPSTDGLIRCGMTQGPFTASCGWEAQHFFVKSTSIYADGWYVFDRLRGASYTTSQKLDFSNANAETTFDSSGLVHVDPNGFYYGGNGPTYIWMAVRRPNKPVTDPTKLFCPVARSGTGVATNINAPGFPADMVLIGFRNAVASRSVFSRLRGSNRRLDTSEPSATNMEGVYNGVAFDNMSGYVLSSNNWNDTYTAIDHAFRRAPGFYEEVCYTGTGAARTIAHSLGSAPGMVWIKRRDTSGFSWLIYHKALGASKFLSLNSTAAAGTDTIYFGGIEPTATHFNPGTAPHTNEVGATHVAMLFGDTPGLCKAFDFIQTSSDAQFVDLGFTPRFVLLRDADGPCGMFVFDTSRGIVAGADPFIFLNSTSAETATTDAVDPAVGGFYFNNATLSGVPGHRVIGWACA